MQMGTAMILKQKVDAREIEEFNEAADYLHRSEVMKELLTDFKIAGTMG